MKTIDIIEQNEEPLEVVLPLDYITDLQEFYGIYVYEA